MEGEGEEIRTLMGEDFNTRMERKEGGVAELIGEKGRKRRAEGNRRIRR